MSKLKVVLIRVGIAIVITTILGVLFLTLEQPYNASLVEKRVFQKDKNTSYFDLNYDGRTERLLLANSTEGRTGIIVYDPDDNIIDQFNVDGKFVKKSYIHHGDYDNNNLAELYFFTYIGDSLFLNIINPFNIADPHISRRYIEGCTNINDEAQYSIIGGVFEDVNDDGFREFYFSISAGFSLQPRALFYYDIINDSVKRSAQAGSSPRYTLSSCDLDDDGMVEIWGNIYAVGNYETNFPYSDSSAWLMIYDHTLEYEFEPVEYKGFTSVLYVTVFERKGAKCLLAGREMQSSINNHRDEISIFSNKGELIVSKNLNDYNIAAFTDLYVWNNEIYLIDIRGNVLIFDFDLNLLKQDKKDWASGYKYGPFIMDEESDQLLAFLNLNGELQLCSPDLKRLATLDLDDMEGFPYVPVFVSKNDTEYGFHLRTNNFDYLIDLSKNKHRNYIFLYALAMFSGFYFLVYFIQLLQYRQEEQRREIESKMRTLQVQAAKSQLSPHFIFNALNSISAMYIQGDNARADAFLTSFSRMIREVVDSSDRLVVTVGEEIEFVRNYLDLEKVRHGDRLSYSIDIPGNCSKWEIPSMCIQTFVENSIKHAFVGKRSMHLVIDAKCSDEFVYIQIEDNGIGFNKTGEEHYRKGKGIGFIRDIFESYRLIKGKKIDYSIFDIGESPDEKGTGTRIKIRIQA